MTVSIDANVTFNPMGEMKPIYVRIEDQNHLLHTYKIEEICARKEERYLGISALIFICKIKVEEQLQEICLKYYVQSHKWAISQE